MKCGMCGWQQFQRLSMVMQKCKRCHHKQGTQYPYPGDVIKRLAEAQADPTHETTPDERATMMAAKHFTIKNH